MKKMLQRISLCLVLVFCLSVFPAFGTAAAETPQITYEFSTDIPGRADGTISVTNLGSIGKNFSLGWGTSKKLLSKYSSSNLVTGAEMKGSDTLKFTLEPFSCIPSDATHLWLSSGGKLVASYEIPQERRLAKEEPLYRFGVVSDIHIGTGASVPNFESAMQIFKMNKASFVISAGDNTENGKENLWQSLSEMANKYNTIPFWFVLGNHDALAWNLRVTPEEAMSYCKQYFPNYVNENHSYGEAFDVTVSDVNPNYDYSFTYQGDLYLFMGIGAASNSSEDKNIDQKLSQSQIDWLDKTLSGYYKKPTHGKVFFTCHYATRESGQAAAGIDANSSKKLHEVLNRYPGVICLTGHSHGGFTGRNNIYVADYASFHVPCLRSDNQGYLVEVYKDYTVFKGMDLYLGDPLDCGTFVLPNNFTDRISAYGITLRVTDGGIVYWKANGGDSSWKKLTSLSELKTDGTVQSLRYYEEDTVDFRTNETHLQWKLSIEDDSAWKDLISLEEMPKSPDGSSDSGNSSSSNSDVTSDSGSASTSTDVGSGNVTENSDTNAGNGSSNDGNNDTSNQGIWIWFVIGACAVVLCGGGIAVALILLKKKK